MRASEIFRKYMQALVCWVEYVTIPVVGSEPLKFETRRPRMLLRQPLCRTSYLIFLVGTLVSKLFHLPF